MTSNWASVIIVACLCATLVTCSISSDRRVEKLEHINNDGVRSMIRITLKHCEDEFPDNCFMMFRLDGSKLKWRTVVEGDEELQLLSGGQLSWEY